MQKNTPKVSVIIPLYNSYQYLEESLNCVVNQTLQDIEIIIVNDGSTDGSEKLAQKFADKDRRIQLIHQENQGAAIARNKGLELAKGEYLSFLDSDDIFELNMLEEMYNHAKKFDAEIVICPFRYIGDASTRHRGLTPPTEISNTNIFSAKQIKNQIFQIVAATPWNKLFLRKHIANNNIKFQNLTSCNDVFFSHYALATSNKISILNNIFVIHRDKAVNAISRTRGSKFTNILKAMSLLKEKLMEDNLFTDFEVSFVKRALSHANYEALHIKNKNDLTELIHRVNLFLQSFLDQD